MTKSKRWKPKKLKDLERTIHLGKDDKRIARDNALIAGTTAWQQRLNAQAKQLEQAMKGPFDEENWSRTKARFGKDVKNHMKQYDYESER